jgi:hypothetical protein
MNGPSATGVTIPIGLLGISSPAFINAENAVASVDYNISDKDSLRGRFILNRVGAIDSSGFPSVFYQTIPTNSYLVLNCVN